MDARAKMCYSKKAYPNKKLANHVAHKKGEEREVKLRSYQCPICFQYHITKKEELNEETDTTD